jgi:hypothetical protein
MCIFPQETVIRILVFTPKVQAQDARSDCAEGQEKTHRPSTVFAETVDVGEEAIMVSPNKYSYSSIEGQSIVGRDRVGPPMS